jgi:hypothetical protein
MSSPSVAVHGGSSLGPPVRCTLAPGNRLPAAVVIPVEHRYLDNIAMLLYGLRAQSTTLFLRKEVIAADCDIDGAGALLSRTATTRPGVTGPRGDNP